MRKILLAVMAMAAMPVFAECYVVDKIEGQSIRANKDGPFEDRYSGQPLEITLAGDNSKSDSLIGRCFEPVRNYLVCTMADSKGYVIHTWHLMPLEKKAIWTVSKVRDPNFLSGGSVMTGEIVGTCP